MKRLALISLLALVLMLVPLLAQDRARESGLGVRTDFEGTHELLRVAPSGTPYVAGASVRIDFEGTHESIGTSTSKSTETRYTPGSSVRIDFEGTHPPK